MVTPFILQYAHDEPWIAALAILPVYEMVARVKAREHWQTDVIVGSAWILDWRLRASPQ